MPILTRLQRVEALRFMVAAASGMIRELATLDSEALTRAAREDPERWEPLLDHLSATMEVGAGTLASVLAALSQALDQ
jgi:hypothetical protein